MSRTSGSPSISSCILILTWSKRALSVWNTALQADSPSVREARICECKLTWQSKLFGTERFAGSVLTGSDRYFDVVLFRLLERANVKCAPKTTCLYWKESSAYDFLVQLLVIYYCWWKKWLSPVKRLIKLGLQSVDQHGQNIFFISEDKYGLAFGDFFRFLVSPICGVVLWNCSEANSDWTDEAQRTASAFMQRYEMCWLNVFGEEAYAFGYMSACFHALLHTHATCN